MARSTYEPAGRRLPPLLTGAALISVAIGAILLIGLAIDRWPLAFDRSIMIGLRRWGGPAWLPNAARDVTALGGGVVLTIVVIAVAGLLLVQRLWLTALATIAAVASGGWVVSLVKAHVARPRPMVVPHLVEVGNMSFPSGHSADSAVVYLTLAALATQVTRDPLVRRYIVAVAILLVGAIGCSRVYLGVHWPSDVAAGWSFGTLWALGWWRATAGTRATIGGERGR